MENRWIKRRLNTLGVSNKNFLKDLGVQEQHFKWLEGKPKISPQILEEIARRLQCDYQKLLLFWDNKISESELFEKSTVTDSNPVYIDILDVRACCGNGIENFTENVIGHHMITLPALKEMTSSAPENIKIIKAIGESMLPTINTDDIIWVDVSVKQPTSDGLYILCIGTDLLIRRIQINPFDNTALIKADNTQYSPIPHANYRDIKVVGKVIYHMRKIA